jgi:hypothetical protein
MGFVYRLLVYWHNGSFIMSDDYPPYLAYRKLGRKKVPVVIVGEFPKGSAEIRRTGGAELLPPILVEHDNTPDSLALELQEFMLDRRLRGKRVSDEVCKLYGLFIDLANLIQNPNTEEKQLHHLLYRNPIVLDAFGVKIRSEVMLGADYRVDLLVQAEYTDRRASLIELERANIPVFTRRGRLRAKVTHAIQQVEDWLRWWREHPTEVPLGLDGSIPVEGLVVVGRSAHMAEADKRRLLSLNHTRQVQGVTYDDLLDRIRSLIANLENGATEQSEVGT